MNLRLTIPLLTAAVLAAPGLVGQACLAESPPGMAELGPEEEAAAPLDANQVFELLVTRYREMESYRDTARLVQVIDRLGDEPERTETVMSCEVSGAKLSVTTPRRELIQHLGLPSSISPGNEMTDFLMSYDFWLAPHMAIKFSAEPLTEMRPGVCDAFTPTEAEQINVDDRAMVHLELKTGDPQSEDYEAKFDFYVNPDSMLIERIEGAQRMPDGAHCHTTLEITPEAPAPDDDAAEFTAPLGQSVLPDPTSDAETVSGSPTMSMPGH